MKNLTFALACASTFALFAKIEVPTAGFESPYEAGNKVVGAGSLTENGATFWFYDGASGSEDGSTVKAYGVDNLAAPTTGDDPGTQYLELSTEGGTLWRSLAAGSTSGEGIGGRLGAAQALPTGGLYIDTMVQFTPTEDGGAPETTGGDKLAIWLNVETGEGLETPVTNLCVKANAYTLGEAGPMAAATTFPLVPADGSALSINPGTWYRLTVKAVANALATDENGIIPAFEIRVDGALMKAASGLPFSEFFGEFVAEGLQAAYGQNALFPSLQEMGGAGASITLQAVGFKGSGALDNLAITEAEPQPTPGPEFAVNWGESGVTAVWGATPPTAAELAAIQAWATANGLSAAQVAGETGAAAYLLGMTTVPSEVPALSITAIDQTAEGWTVTVACSAQPDLSKVNGKLTVKTATSLGEAWTVQTYDASNLAPADGNSKVVIKITGADARFIKAALTK